MGEGQRKTENTEGKRRQTGKRMVYCRICREQIFGSLKEHMDAKHSGYRREPRKWSIAGMQFVIVLAVMFYLVTVYHQQLRGSINIAVWIIPLVSFVIEFYKVIFKMYVGLDKKYREKAKQSQITEDRNLKSAQQQKKLKVQE